MTRSSRTTNTRRRASHAHNKREEVRGPHALELSSAGLRPTLLAASRYPGNVTASSRHSAAFTTATDRSVYGQSGSKVLSTSLSI